MIRFIAAVDDKLGIADEHGIPWQGKIPVDTKYYRDKIKSGTIVMGYGVYKELSKPYPGGINYVASHGVSEKLRPGFELVNDARIFMKSLPGDVWNIGGAALFHSTFDLADELYLTRVKGDYNCTKFFPEFENKFRLSSAEPWQEQNGIRFRFERWLPKD